MIWESRERREAPWQPAVELSDQRHRNADLPVGPFRRLENRRYETEGRIFPVDYPKPATKAPEDGRSPKPRGLPSGTRAGLFDGRRMIR